MREFRVYLSHLFHRQPQGFSLKVPMLLNLDLVHVRYGQFIRFFPSVKHYFRKVARNSIFCRTIGDHYFWNGFQGFFIITRYIYLLTASSCLTWAIVCSLLLLHWWFNCLLSEKHICLSVTIQPSGYTWDISWRRFISFWLLCLSFWLI